MRVENVHERVLEAPASEVGALLDRLATREDPLWPRDRWPAMRFDRPLQVGADGGHGPIRYHVEAYEPGRRVVFRFKRPRGFLGTHALEVLPLEAGRTLLRHRLEMELQGSARLSWPLVFRPLHDALLEDAMDRAVRATGSKAEPPHWSLWVRLLRGPFERALSRRSARKSPAAAAAMRAR